MATAGVTVSEPARFTQFRQAERSLWDFYGLEPTERLVPIGDGQVVRIHELGDGEPVLFVHGTGGSGVYFAPLVRELASSFRCILIDRPGWTLSSPIDYSAGDFGTIAAEFQKNLLTAMDVDRAHVIGGSIGNMFALRLALAYPGRVGNIVLFGGVLVEALTPPAFLRVLRTPLGQIMVRIPQGPTIIRKRLTALGHGRSLSRGMIPDEYINMKAAESRYTDAPKNERQLVRSVLARQGFQPGITLSESELASIDSNTLMIYGLDDPLGSEGMWSDLTAGMPSATLDTCPDSGHLPWFDDPAAVGALTLTHLRRPPTGST